MSLPIDRAWLADQLQELSRVRTDVPLGYDTLMEPDDPQLVHYVQNVVRPRLAEIGFGEAIIDAPRNNLVVQVGTGESSQALLIQSYTPAQHHNLMDDPFSGKIQDIDVDGRPEPVVFGQGVSQNKAHQAVMLAVLKAIRESGVALDGTLYWSVNNEGRSSHECSEAIVASLPSKPDFCILTIGTGLRLSLGNRGRVDVLVHVEGAATHSSEPEGGLNAIDGAAEVVTRLKSLTWNDEHPILGDRHAVVYKVRYDPIAPHTLPGDAYLTIDRRLLPGDDIETAVQEIRNAIGDLSPFQVTVSADVAMLPTLVDPSSPHVEALADAHESVVGAPLENYYGRGSFDAGGPASLGIPTVMYGASGGDGLLGADFVSLRAVESEAAVLAQFIVDTLGSSKARNLA
jgi:acetylornithine deacetylase/succinyl-diaminopimelate desuccinylase-like protein